MEKNFCTFFIGKKVLCFFYDCKKTVLISRKYFYILFEKLFSLQELNVNLNKKHSESFSSFLFKREIDVEMTWRNDTASADFILVT